MIKITDSSMATNAKNYRQKSLIYHILIKLLHQSKYFELVSSTENIR